MNALMKALIVIPAYNEEKLLRQNVTRVLEFLRQQRGFAWRVLVAENGSTDRTLEILRELSAQNPAAEFSFQSFPVRSKSGAIKQAWLSEEADLYIHMDADLSTDIAHLPELVAGIEEGYDLVIGSRCLPQSTVARSVKRNVISRGYNWLTRWLFSLDVSDTQCGFKAVNRRVRDEIVRQTRHLSEGFMDTEMLIRAAAKGCRIKEIPVRWRDDRKSQFNLWRVTWRFLLNLMRVKWDLWREARTTPLADRGRSADR